MLTKHDNNTDDGFADNLGFYVPTNNLRYGLMERRVAQSY